MDGWTDGWMDRSRVDGLAMEAYFSCLVGHFCFSVPVSLKLQVGVGMTWSTPKCSCFFLRILLSGKR